VGTRSALAWARLIFPVLGVALLAACAGGGASSSQAPVAPTATTGAPSTTGAPTATTTLRPATSRPPRPTTTKAAPVTPPTTAAPGPPRVLPRGPYTDWHWPPPPATARYTAQDLDLTVLSDPGPTTPYFFAHQFGFDKGVGGYVGLQTRATLGPGPDAPIAKIALFSVFAGCDDRTATPGCPRPQPLFGASERSGPICSPMTSPGGNAPEGPGASCRVPYEWREGVTYRLQVFLAAPHLWQANVVDVSTGAVTVVGQVRVPDTWGGLSTFSVSWIEYYGDTTKLENCADIPVARIRWDGAAGTQALPGGVLGLGGRNPVTPPTSLHNHLTPGAAHCSNSFVSDLSPVGSGVVQRVGGT